MPTHNATPISPHPYSNNLVPRALSVFKMAAAESTAVKRPKRFSFYLVGFYLMLSEPFARMYKIVS